MTVYLNSSFRRGRERPAPEPTRFGMYASRRPHHGSWTAGDAQSDSIVMAARRSPGFSLRNSARARLASCSEPLSAAFAIATVQACPAPQLKPSALASRPTAAGSILVSSIALLPSPAASQTDQQIGRAHV